MKTTRTMLSLLLAALLLLAACTAVPAGAPTGGEQPAAAPAGEKVKLTILTHWGEESLLKPMKAKLDEYMAANPNVEIDHQAVTFNELLTHDS